MSASLDPFREASRSLLTTVALITTTGKHGPNVMAAEWTMQVSYRPMRLIILVHPRDATYDNILETREFGANFASDNQATLASLAGAYTGKQVNKLSSNLFQTHPAKKIHAPMIADCFLNIECKLVDTYQTGDHTMFLGEALEATTSPDKNPLLYNQRKYWQKGPQITKKPLVYTTLTIHDNQLHIDGRLQGAEDYPQTIHVTVTHNNTDKIIRDNVTTDEYGYFQLAQNSPTLKGVYEATATWNGLTGTGRAQAE